MMPSVLYVTGWCRTGSTLFSNLLNELPGIAHVGELHYLWRNGVLGLGTNRSCGCGALVLECPMWTEVLGKVVAGPLDAYAREALADQRAYLRTRHIGARLAEACGQRRPPAGAAAAADRLAGLYEAIATVTGASLVIDSSKYPAEAATLCGRDDLDVAVLHMVRDPRATAYSWSRPKGYIPAMSVPRSGAYWTAFNHASDRIGSAFPRRYLRLRYEDFCAEPAAALRRVLSLVGRDDPAPVAADGTATLGTNHTVTGNPDRLVRGSVRVRPDDQWRTSLPLAQQFLATALAAPVLRRYDYRYTR